MKKVIAISGSTRSNSSNRRLLELFAEQAANDLYVEIYDSIDTLPHFNPDLDNEAPPAAIVSFRNLIADSDAVLICTPEYVFSIPGSLKNCLEWCVSTTLLSEKPLGIITASSSGEKAHEELQMIMKVLGADFSPATTLLIQGIKGKIGIDGIIHKHTQDDFNAFVSMFTKFVQSS